MTKGAAEPKAASAKSDDSAAKAAAAVTPVPASGSNGAPPADAVDDEEDEEDDAEDEEGDAGEGGQGAAGAKKKKNKKKKKKSKAKAATAADGTEGAASSASGAITDLTKQTNTLAELVKTNPALAEQLKGMEPSKAEEMLKRLNLQQLFAGMQLAPNSGEKPANSYRFWNTQPVTKFGEKVEKQGPIRPSDISKVSKEPPPLVAGFEWSVIDVTEKKQLDEVYQLLSAHYVEDKEAMFRFNYSASFLNWALKSPGWTQDWHIGVRASESKKLVAFISAIPLDLRVRGDVLKASEVNFLCVHKKLRDKRLAPVLIAEVTRRCNLKGVFQALYSAGKVLPTPMAACRYYHRSLNWLKLHEVGFSPMPPGSTVQRQLARFALPKEPQTPNLRVMESKDVDDVYELLGSYLKKFDMTQEFSKEEISHWVLQSGKIEGEEQIVWAYVVEDPETKKITDFFSFYSLSSTVIGHKQHSQINVAYLFYLATATGISQPLSKLSAGQASALKTQLNALVHDALILANNAGFDVFNALTLQDNNLFLEQQKFGPGDGYLHYYLYNYRAEPVRGGVMPDKSLDEKGSGVGVVML